MSISRRNAILAVLAAPLGDYRAFAQSTLPTGKATLTIDLDRWHGIEVKIGRNSAFVPSGDIFEALREKG